MSNSPLTPGVVGSAAADAYASNFADHAPPLDRTKRGWRRTVAISATMRPA
jgi:hypothetical protein